MMEMNLNILCIKLYFNLSEVRFSFILNNSTIPEPLRGMKRIDK
jgi:hypothetical protein